MKKVYIVLSFLVYFNFQVFYYFKFGFHVLLKLQGDNTGLVVGKNEFCVIAPVFNPAFFQSRYESYRKFEVYIRKFGVQLVTVELAIGNQTFQVTYENNPNHIQLRSNDVLWYKENLINIGVRRSPQECKYIAWIDLEVEFLNKNWIEEAIEALQRFKIIQLFDLVLILGVDTRPIEARVSYMRCHLANRSYTNPPDIDGIYKKLNLPSNEDDVHYCATGFAWAAQKQALLEIGGLFDKGIIGAGDYISVLGFLGKMGVKTVSGVRGDYLLDTLEWQNHVFKYVNASVGCITHSTITHTWHGSKQNRGYKTRKQIVNSYNPSRHVYYDEQGLLHFQPDVKAYFMNRTVGYFMSRREDFKPN